MGKPHRTVLLFVTCGCAAVLSACGGTGSRPQPHQSGSNVGASSLFALQPSLERNGDPVPSVGAYPDGTASLIHYSMCPSATASSCTAVGLVDGMPLPGPRPAGTVFRVTARYHGRRYDSSARWRGTVRVIRAPTLDGVPRVGATIVAQPARWSGGWATDRNQLAVEACRTRAGIRCVMLTGVWLECTKLGCSIQGGVPGNLGSDSSARIGYALSGWYLFSLDARLGLTADGLVGVSSPAALPVWRTSPIVVRSAPYGPVSGPPGPQVHVLRHARVTGRHVIVAAVRCAVRCHAWVTVALIGRHFAASQRVVWSANEIIDGSGSLGVWGSIPRGRVTVQVNVGDGPYVHGRLRVIPESTQGNNA